MHSPVEDTEGRSFDDTAASAADDERQDESRAYTVWIASQASVEQRCQQERRRHHGCRAGLPGRPDPILGCMIFSVSFPKTWTVVIDETGDCWRTPSVCAASGMSAVFRLDNMHAVYLDACCRPHPGAGQCPETSAASAGRGWEGAQRAASSLADCSNLCMHT